MIRLLRTLLLGRSEKTPSPPVKTLGIDLKQIEGALIVAKGFPRPQWKIIHAWIKKQIAEEDVSLAWQEVSWNWLCELRDRLGGDYAVSQSKNFLLLSSRRLDTRRSILNTSEIAVKLLVEWLGPIAEKRGHGKHVVMDFGAIDDYYEYVAYFYPSDTGVRASGGIFLRGGYYHIALPPLPNPQDTLIHELTHNRLAHLPLPAWLNEGIAMAMERRIGGSRSGQLDRELHRKHRAYWTAETIGAFWSGDSFHDNDGEVIHLSYSLAATLVDLLVQEFGNFLDFVTKARRDDAGQAAAQEIFGVDLNEIASTFLGPGDWTSCLAKRPKDCSGGN